MPLLHGGPRGIRTPDLLNAIETRSQLRYGPGTCSLLIFRPAAWCPCKEWQQGQPGTTVCGPEGIRTPDLLSAIEARSQLRYRPRKTGETNST